MYLPRIRKLLSLNFANKKELFSAIIHYRNYSTVITGISNLTDCALKDSTVRERK